MHVLTMTDRFADTNIYYGGVPSPEVCAFSTVVREPDADALFKDLVANANVATRLYALCGLYFTDHEYFLTLVDQFRGATEEVDTQMGCIGGHVSVGYIVENTASNVLRLEGPEDSIEAWAQRNSRSTDDGYAIDIAGGGYPERFRRFDQCLNE